jgi:hypothetical protein
MSTREDSCETRPVTSALPTTRRTNDWTPLSTDQVTYNLQVKESLHRHSSSPVLDTRANSEIEGISGIHGLPLVTTNEGLIWSVAAASMMRDYISSWVVIRLINAFTWYGTISSVIIGRMLRESISLVGRYISFRNTSLREQNVLLFGTIQ